MVEAVLETLAKIKTDNVNKYFIIKIKLSYF